MTRRWKHAYQCDTQGAPRLGKADALLFMILLYLFNHIHPRYQDYIDALHQWVDLQRLERRADYYASWQTYFAPQPRDWVRPFAPPVRDMPASLAAWLTSVVAELQRYAGPVPHAPSVVNRRPFVPQNAPLHPP